MKPLFIFETPEKQVSSNSLLRERIETTLIPKLKKLKFKVNLHTIEEFGRTDILEIKEGKRTILTIPWVRPHMPGKPAKALADYPRLNIPEGKRIIVDKQKVRAMRQLVKKYNMYFLVVLDKPNDEELYWLGKYEDIPEEFWKLTYRKKDKKLDRIHFPKFPQTGFVRAKQFRKEVLNAYK
jgi:hypothetical protein